MELDFKEVYARAQAGDIGGDEKSAMLESAARGEARPVSVKQVPPPGQVVYYIKFCCRVKIGTTAMLEARLAELPHDALLATEPGDRTLEQKRHKQFADSRITGEWFTYTPALEAHVLAVRKGLATDPARRFVTTDAAMLYTGKSRHTLYRWATEGKVTRYQRDGKRMWDALELPPEKP